MGLWRNREFRIVLSIIGLITLVGTIIAAWISLFAAIIVFVSSVCIVSAWLVFTLWRYREIKKLSEYLRRISAGDTTLDVRDNYEGELSILKSEIYKMTLKLSEHSTHLEQDKLELTNAISDISHQLKTPLTSLMVMADLLSDAELPSAKRNEFTQNIQTQLERMEWLVSSLLKLSKIDAGTAQFKNEPVNVDQLIHQALQPVLIPIDIKEIEITIQGDPSISFVGDRNWTAEALINILKNCVEHTPKGGKIHISFSENPLFTEITIADNGIGIAKEDLPYIFRRFYKGKNASEDSVGIGLAMAHSIITKQNGTIEVISRPNNGTQFHIKFYKQIV